MLMATSQDLDGHQKAEQQEEDLRELGKRLLRKRGTRLGGRVGIPPKQWSKTDIVGLRV